MYVAGYIACASDIRQIHDFELTARRHAGSGMFCGQLQTVTEDTFLFLQ